MRGGYAYGNFKLFGRILTFPCKIIIVLMPVLVANVLLLIKLFFIIKEWKSGSAEATEGKIHGIIPYLLLLTYLLFLLFFVVNMVFFPKIRLMPKPFILFGFILYLLFWIPVIVLFAMGHAAGTGAPFIQKTIMDFFNINPIPNKKGKWSNRLITICLTIAGLLWYLVLFLDSGDL